MKKKVYIKKHFKKPKMKIFLRKKTIYQYNHFYCSGVVVEVVGFR